MYLRRSDLGVRAVVVLSVLAVSLLLLSVHAQAQEDDVAGNAQEVAGPCDALPLQLQLSCELASVAIGAGGGAVLGGLVSSGAEAALRAIVEWVVGGAAWLLAELLALLDATTRPDVTQGWFSVAYADMATIAVLLMLPLLLLSIIQALARQSFAHLSKAAFVYVPVAAVGMFAAVAVVDQLVTVTDALTGWISQSTGANLTAFAENVGTALVATGMATGDPAAGAALPGFAALLGAGVIGFASFVIWVLLVLRQAAIYVAVLFLPLAFAALVWPSTAHWLRRLLEGLVAIIMSKFVIVAVMALASGALNAIAEEGFAVLVSGGAMLLMAAFSPFVLLRLIPVFESGLANQLEGTTNARTSPVPGPTAGGMYRGVQHARAASAARATGGGGSMAMAGAGAATAGAGLAAAGAARAGSAMSSGMRQTAGVAAAASGSATSSDASSGTSGGAASNGAGADATSTSGGDAGQSPGQLSSARDGGGATASPASRNANSSTPRGQNHPAPHVAPSAAPAPARAAGGDATSPASGGRAAAPVRPGSSEPAGPDGRRSAPPGPPSAPSSGGRAGGPPPPAAAAPRPASGAPESMRFSTPQVPPPPPPAPASAPMSPPPSPTAPRSTP